MLKRNIKSLAVWLLGLFVLAAQSSCSEHKMIPEDEMQSIITELLLTNSLLTSAVSEISSQVDEQDTVDYYAPILKKYGYQFADFRYTVEEMNARKSNPLDNILEGAVSTIDKEAEQAEYKYRMAQKFDSAAIKVYTDTIYSSDAIYEGRPTKEQRVELAGRFAQGDYAMELEYRSMSSYTFPQKAVKYYFASNKPTINKKEITPNIIWLPRNGKNSELNKEMLYNQRWVKMDSLVFYIDQNKTNKKFDYKLDSSYVKNIKIIYTPPIEDIRQRYFYSFYGEDYFIGRDYIDVPELRADIPYSIIDTLQVRHLVDSLNQGDSLKRVELKGKIDTTLRLKTIKAITKVLDKDSSATYKLRDEIEKLLWINNLEDADSLIRVDSASNVELFNEVDSLLKVDAKFQKDSIEKAEKRKKKNK